MIVIYLVDFPQGSRDFICELTNFSYLFYVRVLREESDQSRYMPAIVGTKRWEDIFHAVPPMLKSGGSVPLVPQRSTLMNMIKQIGVG